MVSRVQARVLATGFHPETALAGGTGMMPVARGELILAQLVDAPAGLE